MTFIGVWKHQPFGGDVDPRDIVVFSENQRPVDDGNACATYSYEAGRR